MQFSAQMIEVADGLRIAGHTPDISDAAVAYASGARRLRESADHKVSSDAIRTHYRKIVNADAVLILNYEKRGIIGYIGGNSLIEMGYAYALEKKIYLLNTVPDMSYTDEIIAMKPVELHGRLGDIAD